MSSAKPRLARDAKPSIVPPVKHKVNACCVAGVAGIPGELRPHPRPQASSLSSLWSALSDFILREATPEPSKPMPAAIARTSSGQSRGKANSKPKAAKAEKGPTSTRRTRCRNRSRASVSSRHSDITSIDRCRSPGGSLRSMSPTSGASVTTAGTRPDSLPLARKTLRRHSRSHSPSSSDHTGSSDLEPSSAFMQSEFHDDSEYGDPYKPSVSPRGDGRRSALSSASFTSHGSAAGVKGVGGYAGRAYSVTPPVRTRPPSRVEQLTNGPEWFTPSQYRALTRPVPMAHGAAPAGDWSDDYAQQSHPLRQYRQHQREYRSASAQHDGVVPRSTAIVLSDRVYPGNTAYYRSSTPPMPPPSQSLPPPSTAQASWSSAQGVVQWFRTFGLERYAHAFVRDGWDDLTLLCSELASDTGDNLMRTVGVWKAGHRAKIKHAAVAHREQRMTPLAPQPALLPAAASFAYPGTPAVIVRMPSKMIFPCIFSLVFALLRCLSFRWNKRLAVHVALDEQRPRVSCVSSQLSGALPCQRWHHWHHQNQEVLQVLQISG